MKNLLPLLVLILCASCVPEKSVFVWTVKDVVGLIIFGGLILFFTGVFIYLWLEEKYQRWKKRKNNL